MIIQIKNIINSHLFNNFITGVILLQALVLALETSTQLKYYYFIFETVNAFVLLVFIVEASLKIISSHPSLSNYFKNGWNILDFTIIVLSLIPFTGGYTTVGRLIRLLRITRLTHRSKEMSIVVTTIIKSIPNMVNIFLLLSLLFFIYGIAGYHLFSNIDPRHWGSLPISLVTLFQILTLEGWVDIMHPLAAENPLYTLFFISFIISGTFIVINIFVAVIVRKSEEAYQQIQKEEEKTSSLTQNEILEEIKEKKKKIESLESKLSK